MLQTRSLHFAIAGLAAAFAATGCAGSKSANPLSASVAGPIPGVEITAPKPVNPAGGIKVATDQQPITLTVENASTNGPRSLIYVFEVATDAGFTSPVYTQEGITPGEGNSTSLRLPDPLAPERSYYWRARAQDGANTGPYSNPANFNVITPIVIGAPALVSPTPNAVVPSLRPKIVFANAPRSGPVGPITYLIEGSTSDSFASKLGFTVAEQPNQTSAEVPQDLAYSTYYFWHVRASDPTTIGPWSATWAFLTPAPPPPPPPTPTAPIPGPGPGGGGGGGGTAPPDAIDLSRAIIHNSPQDVATWAATSTMTRLDLMPSGAHVESSKQNQWPDVVPPGWDGNLQYTLWIVLKINGVWHASGCIQYWRGLYENGGPVTQYAQNWYYDPIRWGPMSGHQPSPGEQVGFFITAGDARNYGPAAVRERSNVVMVAFPSGGGQSFRF